MKKNLLYFLAFAICSFNSIIIQTASPNSNSSHEIPSASKIISSKEDNKDKTNPAVNSSLLDSLRNASSAEDLFASTSHMLYRKIAYSFNKLLNKTSPSEKVLRKKSFSNEEIIPKEAEDNLLKSRGAGPKNVNDHNSAETVMPPTLKDNGTPDEEKDRTLDKEKARTPDKEKDRTPPEKCNSIMLRAGLAFAPQSVQDDLKRNAAKQEAQKIAQQRRIEENLKRFNDVRKTIADIKERFKNNNVYTKISATELSNREKRSQITTIDTFADLFNQGCVGPLSKITSDKQSLQKIDPILLKEATNESVRLYKKIVEVGSGIVDECLITRNFKSCQTVVNFCKPHNFLKKDPAAKDTIEMFDKMKDRMLSANPDKFCYHWTGFDFPPIDLVAKVANHTIVPATKLSYNLTLGAAPKVIDWSGEMSSTWWDSINEGHSIKSTYDLAAAGAGTYIAYRILKSVWNKHKTTNSLLEKMIAVGKGCIDTDVVAGLACALFGSTIHLHIYNHQRKNGNRYDTDCTALDIGSRLVSAAALASAYSFVQKIDARTPDVPAPAVGSDGSTSRGNIKQMIRDCLAYLQSRIQ